MFSETSTLLTHVFLAFDHVLATSSLAMSDCQLSVFHFVHESHAVCRALRSHVIHQQKAYLITSIHLLIQQLSTPIPPDLLAAHIRLLVSHHGSLGFALLPPKTNTPEKILRVARKYSNKAPACAAVWLARLAAEKQFARQENVDRAWTEARKYVEGDGVQEVWLWGLEPQNRHRSSADAENEADVNAEVEVVEVRARCSWGNRRTGVLTGGLVRSSPPLSPAQHLLHESQLIRHPAAATALREALLIRYAATTHHALSLLYRLPTSRHEGTASSLSAVQSLAAGTHSSLGVATDVREIAPTQRKWRRQDSHWVGPSAKAGDHGDEPDSPSMPPPLLDARLARVRRIGTAYYLPSARVWSGVFEQESSGSSQAEVAAATPSDAIPGSGDAGLYSGDVDADARVLGSVYEFWRQQDGVGATIAWATWLLRNGKAKSVAGVIARVRSVLGQADGERVEGEWKRILDGGAGAGEGGEDGSMEDAAPTLGSMSDMA